MGKAGSSILNQSGLDNMSKDHLMAGKRQESINAASVATSGLKIEDAFSENRNAGFRANSVTAVAKEDSAFTSTVK